MGQTHQMCGPLADLKIKVMAPIASNGGLIGLDRGRIHVCQQLRARNAEAKL